MYHSKDELLIKPDQRSDYQPEKGYPKQVIFGHSRKWPRIIGEQAKLTKGLKVHKHTKTSTEDEVDFSFRGRRMKYVYTPEGALALHTQIVRTAMKGARHLINIGCAGGVAEELNIGDKIVCQKAIRESGFGKHLASDDEPAVMSPTVTEALLNVGKSLSAVPELATVWCVHTLYYTANHVAAVLKHQEKPHIVEMESEAGAITAGWLNANYFSNDPVQYGQLAYISDGLPTANKTWEDPFPGNRTEKMVKWKTDSFWIALKTLLEL